MVRMARAASRWRLIVGYARVSTTERNLVLDHDDLKPAFDASVDQADARKSMADDPVITHHGPAGSPAGVHCRSSVLEGKLCDANELGEGIMGQEHAAVFPERARRVVLDDVAAGFPFPMAVTYARLQDGLDRQEPVSVAWLLRDAFERAFKVHGLPRRDRRASGRRGTGAGEPACRARPQAARAIAGRLALATRTPA